MKQDYKEAAKNNEKIFRLILDRFKKKHSELSIDEIFTKYSEGNRYGIWTILDFKEVEPDIFEFSHEDIATLSGVSGTDLWAIEDGELKHVKELMYWMS